MGAAICGPSDYGLRAEATRLARANWWEAALGRTRGADAVMDPRLQPIEVFSWDVPYATCFLCGREQRCHPQVHTAPLGCLDVGVADCVLALDAAGYATTESCQGHPGLLLGRAYVGFAGGFGAALGLVSSGLSVHARAGDPLGLWIRASVMVPPFERVGGLRACWWHADSAPSASRVACVASGARMRSLGCD